MHPYKNEQGAALVIILIMIVLFSILGLTLGTLNIQSSKLRAIGDNEIQGKMLADLGLLYFQKYTEKNLEDSMVGNEAHQQHVEDTLKNIASPITASQTEDFEKYHQAIKLPGDDKGGFRLAYEIINKGKDSKGNPIPNPVLFKKGETEPSQPYSFAIKLYVVGLPPQLIDASKPEPGIVTSSAIVYINTVPAPFHYALSTPGELRLFGGSNIIGNVAASKLWVGMPYHYREVDSYETPTNTPWKHGPSSGDPSNEPYIEGKVFLPKDQLRVLPKNKVLISGLGEDSNELEGENDKYWVEEYELNSVDITNNFDLRDKGILTPKPLTDANNEVQLSAPSARPYYPGYEPPLLVEGANKAKPLFKGKTVKEYVDEQFAASDSDLDIEANVLEIGEESFSLEEIPAFKSLSYWKSTSESTWKSSKKRLVIHSTSTLGGGSATARLTGNQLNDNNITELFISSNDSNAIATVEMGRKSSFEGGSDTEPFTFSGSIYIKGILDIVGDIKVNGTIYVDGDVNILDIKNLDQQNLVIIASGNINLSDRNEANMNEWINLTAPKLSAFLYSEKQLKLFFVTSFNWINGGIASGSNLEINAKRELDPNLTDEFTGNPSRLTIQFNRRIFEEPIPGLPAGDEFHIDIYDIKYH